VAAAFSGRNCQALATTVRASDVCQSSRLLRWQVGHSCWVPCW